MIRPPRHLIQAWKEQDQAERDPGDNPRIIQYHQVTTLRATTDVVAWCAAFACWCLEQVGIRSPRSARARDFLEWGAKLERPAFGCVVVLWRVSPAAMTGHVGFWMGETETTVYVWGGNQNNRVGIEGYDKSRVLGYRWPMGKGSPPVPA